MNIAVIDTAAENGGALSVLKDYITFLNCLENDRNEWFVFANINVNSLKSNIHIINTPYSKKSWLHRLIWDNFMAPKILGKYSIDIILSLQNTGFLFTKIPQVIYFHNVLLLEKHTKYSILKKDERIYAFYTSFIAFYTFLTMRKSAIVIVQTNTVKNDLIDKWKLKNIKVVNPNVYLNRNENTNLIGTKISGLIYPATAVPFKNHLAIVRCVKENEQWFKDNNFNIYFTLTGSENGYSKKVLNLSENTENIKFLGYLKRDEVEKLYYNNGLIANSSIESYPIPFLEAMNYGTPILSVDYNYAKEILLDYDNKQFFEKNNIISMFEGIKNISNHLHIKPKFKDVGNTWKKVNDIIFSINEVNHDNT